MLISKPPQGYGHHILYQYFNYINVLGSGGSVVLLTLPNSPQPELENDNDNDNVFVGGKPCLRELNENPVVWEIL